MNKNDTFQCENCNKTFTVLPKTWNLRIKRGHRPGRFCSQACYLVFAKANRETIKSACTQCSKPIERYLFEFSKSKNHFCSKSCAATYNNTHKTYGTRRSKLEQYIEQQLRTDFPNLALVCNGKEAIGSELDFYFPDLRLAIELNGIFHYEPIYGDDKLERIQANDQQKSIACYNAGIELCVIDISQVKHATKIIKERYYTIVRDLVVRLLGRADSTNAQVL